MTPAKKRSLLDSWALIAYLSGERMDQSGVIPHQRHHDLAAGLESDSRSDVRRDHDLPLHRGLHDRHGVLLEECWFYLQITSITLSRWVYHGESVSLRLCHRLLGKRGTSESGRLCQGAPHRRRRPGLGHAGHRSCRLCSARYGLRFA